MNRSHTHEIAFDENRKVLIINRLIDQSRVLYTEIDIPSEPDKVTDFLTMVGEAVMIDSRIGRKLLGVD